MMDDSASVEVLSVAELGRMLRRTVELATEQCAVQGEVSSFKRAPSGHVYFCLKDESEDAVIDCVMYRFQAQRARRVLAEGARVRLVGRASFWAPRGRLQFIAESARSSGKGALLEALEKLKRKLADEGLFALERKRTLPSQPRVVGVVTSAAGAALHDIRTVAFRRGGVHIILSPALVQGDGAPESLVRALDLIERYAGVEVVIIGRGGGSFEDLMAFNDERVVRRLARCRVPTVSAVGHEVDHSLTDLVADVRAATPSQAAELVIADTLAQREAMSRALKHLTRAMLSGLELERAKIDRLRTRLSDPRFVIAERQQHLDELQARLERQMRNIVARRRGRAVELHRRLSTQHPQTIIARSRSALSPLRVRLDAAMRASLKRAQTQLGRASGGLDTLSPLRVLERGYAIVTDDNRKIVRSHSQVRPGSRIAVRLHDGGLLAKVVEGQAAAAEEILANVAPRAQPSADCVPKGSGDAEESS